MSVYYYLSVGKKCELQCRDGSGCFKSYQECDGIPHCFDNSDESNCELVRNLFYEFNKTDLW